MKLLYLAFLTLLCGSLHAQKLDSLVTLDDQRHPLTFEDMYALGRVSDPQIAPDGSSILYVVTRYSLETNRGNSDIFITDMTGDKVEQLTSFEGADNTPRWSPDSKTIAFISTRENGAQVWFMDADGSNQRRMTNLSTGAEGVVWSPTGTHLAFASSVYADCPDDDCNKQRDLDKAADPVKVMITDKLTYRVWDHWKDGKYSHVFVMPAKGGTPVDVTPGTFDTPPIDIGGDQDYVFSPDGKELAFVKNTAPIVAASTNNDIWLVNIDGSKPRCITKDNWANDNQPVYSPDGKYIAYRAMSEPGYEADKYDLLVYDRAKGQAVNLTRDIDRSIEQIIWYKGSDRLIFTANEGPYKAVYDMPRGEGDVLRVLKGVLTLRFQDRDTVKMIDLGTYRHDFRLHPDGKTLIFIGERINYPAELMSIQYENGLIDQIRQITKTNLALLGTLDMPAPESFTFKSFDGAEVQGWILTPPGFDPTKKYPMIYLVHGGPQGSWADDFHYRWNLELFAAPGFVVAAVNCRGSVGFGQKFTNGVNGDWGGAPYKDLMTGLDYIVKTYPYVDKNRVGAAGASYGGYMMNWFLGNTDRFKAIFTHAGVYDLVSMYGGTEELWFPEWEFKGTPWKNPKLYEKWSPSSLAGKFKTPTYVSHGQLDFRVPVEQGMQLFTALQRQGVESKFMYFPDEGHLVLKPRNSRLWYGEFQRWFEKHLKNR